MNNLPELTDDAVIELSREGGFAFIPKLTGLRRIELARLPEAQKRQVCAILRQALPLGKPQGANNGQIGQGDRFYFRIQISYTAHPQRGSIVILIPEQVAPVSLQELWRDGENAAPSSASDGQK